MDPKRFKEAYQRLQSLDERLTYRVRPRDRGSLSPPRPEKLEVKLRDLASYTIELKEIVNDLFVAIASKSDDT